MCTETKPNSQFANCLPSANRLFNRTVFWSHANVSIWESKTQTFPVVLVTYWSCVRSNIRKYRSCSTWRRCPFHRSSVLGAASLTSSKTSNIFHMKTTLKNMFTDPDCVGHLNMSVWRLSKNHVRTKCVAHCTHTWVRRTTGANNVMTWMDMKQSTKKTVPKYVVVTTLTIQASPKWRRSYHTSLHQFVLHRLSSHVREKKWQNEFSSVYLLVQILSSSTVRTISRFVVTVKQLASLFTRHSWLMTSPQLEVYFFLQRIRTECATERSTMPTPRDSNNHHPKLLSTSFLVQTLYEGRGHSGHRDCVYSLLRLVGDVPDAFGIQRKSTL